MTSKHLHDERKILYLILNNGKKSWRDRDFVVANIKNGYISNAKMSGNNIVQCNEILTVEKLNSKNIHKLYRFLTYYIESIRNDMYYTDFSLDEFVKEYKNGLEACLEKYSPCYVSFLGNKLVGFFSLFIELGCPVIYTLYCEDNNWNRCARLLSSKIKDSVFYKEYYSRDLEKYGFKSMNLRSSFNEEYDYSVYHGVYLTQYDDNRFLKYIEKNYIINKIDLSKVKLELVKGADFSDIFKKYYYTGVFDGYWRSRQSNMYKLVGFTYFTFTDALNTKDKDFLIAIYNNKIVGIIKMGIWDDHQSIAYIDVMETCRNQGLASYMIKNIEGYLYNNYPLCLTDESEMGKKCHMADKVKKAVSKVTVKTYEECLRDRSYT